MRPVHNSRILFDLLVMHSPLFQVIEIGYSHD